MLWSKLARLMRTSSLLCISLLVMLSGSPLSAADAAPGTTASSGNLLSNASFEDWSEGEPVGWSLYKGGAGTVTEVTGGANVQDGAKAVKMYAPNAGDAAWVQQGYFGVTGGERYKVSFYYKRSASAGYAWINFTIKDGSDQYILPTTSYVLPMTVNEDYVLFEKEWELPAEAAIIHVGFEMGNGAGELVVDNVVFEKAAPPAPSTNVLTNAGFETWDANEPEGWWLQQNGAGAVTRASDAADVQEGSSAVKMYAPNSGDYAYVNQGYFAIQGGERYKLSFYYKKTATGTGYSQVDFTFKDADNEFILPTTVVALPGGAVGQFTKFEAEVFVPEEAVIVNLGFEQGYGAGTLIVDNVVMEKAAAAEPSPNLLTNASFEEWNDGTPAGWWLHKSGSGTVTEMTGGANVQDGTKAVRMYAPNAGDAAWVQQGYFGVTGGERYKISFYYKKTATSTGYAWINFTIKDGNDDFILPTTSYALPVSANEAYVLFEKEWDLPEEAAKIHVGFEMGNGAGELVVDNVAFRKVEASGGENVNLLRNPGFDSWQSNSLRNWTAQTAGAGQVNRAQQWGQYLSGSGLELRAAAAGDTASVIQAQIPVEGNRSYRASFNYRTNFIADQGFVKVIFYDENMAEISSKQTDLYKEEQTYLYPRAELDATAPANAKSASLLIQVKHGLVWLDEASFKKFENLLVNGTFEVAVPGSGWTADVPDTPGAAITWQASGGYDLPGAVQLAAAAGEGELRLSHAPVALVDNVRRYKVDALYQVVSMAEGAEALVRLTWLDEEGLPLAFAPFEAETLDRSGQWRRLTQVLLKPDDAVSLQLELVGRSGASVVNWDGIQVEPWRDMYKADGTPASDLDIAYEWNNQIDADLYWSKIPEAQVSAPAGSVWTDELVRRHFFGLSGLHYLSYYAPINNKAILTGLPYMAETVGVIQGQGDPGRVIAGDLPYNVTASALSFNGGPSEYFPAGNHGRAGIIASHYKMTGDDWFKDQSEQLVQFNYYSQYGADGDNPFIRIHYPDDWAKLVAAGRNVEYRGGWDYQFVTPWTNSYGYTYPKHGTDAHVNAQIGSWMLDAYPLFEDDQMIDSVYDFAYNMLPKDGYGYGFYKGRKYYYFGYGPSTTGIPDDASNPIGDGTDNIHAAKAHVLAKLGYLTGDKKMLEVARGLLWYQVREFEYDGAFYYDSAENPLNSQRAVLDRSHEVMQVWDSMHAYTYLKQAGVELGPETEGWKRILDMTLETGLWYEGTKHVKAIKAYNGTPEADEELEIVTFLQAMGQTPVANARWTDQLGSHIIRPDSLNVRISRILPPTAANDDWTVDAAKDVVYEISADQLENSGITLPWTLQQGDTYRIAYTVSTDSGFDRSVDRMPDSQVSFYTSGDDASKLELVSAMAPPMDTDYVVNAANMLSFQATLFFPFEDAVSAQLNMPAPPAVQSALVGSWDPDAINEEVKMYFNSMGPSDYEKPFYADIFGNVSVSGEIEYRFMLPRTSEMTYDVVLEQMSGDTSYVAKLDGTVLEQRTQLSTAYPSTTYKLGSVALKPGMHTVSFDAPLGVGLLNLKLVAKSTVDALPELAHLAVSGLSRQMQQGTSANITVTAHYMDGTTADVTDEATFSSSAPGVASVSGNGVVSAHSAGSATVSAVFEGKTTGFKLQVTGQSQSGGPGIVTGPADNGGTDNPSSGNDCDSPGQPACEAAIELKLTDIGGHWAEAGIRKAIAAGIVKGYPNGTFLPEREISREQFVVMLMRALRSDVSPAALTFTDKGDIGAWAQRDIALAVQLGFVNGYKDGSFRPQAAISRIEIAALIARARGLQAQAGAAAEFSDIANLPKWAGDAVAAVSQQGIVKGHPGGIFAPYAMASRAEAVVMLLRMLETTK